MRKLLLTTLAVMSLAAGSCALASTSAMTATVTDRDGTAWANATYTATLQIPGQPGTVPTISGVPVSPLTVTGTANSSGVISGTFTDTSSVDQPNAVWVFSLQPNASVAPVTVSVAIIGATPSLTANFTGLPAPRFPAGSAAYGYADVEVTNTALGVSYFNTSTLCSATGGVRQYSNTGWQCGGDGGQLPGGAAGSIQYNNGGTFGGATITGPACGNGSSAPAQCTQTQTNTALNGGSPFTGLRKANGASSADTQASSTDVTNTIGSVGSVAYLLPGYTTYLPITETSGTTLADASGNGNTCTFASGSNAPTFTQGGIQFATTGTPTKSCSFPASTSLTDATPTNARSFFTVVYTPPTTNGVLQVYGVVVGGTNNSRIGAPIAVSTIQARAIGGVTIGGASGATSLINSGGFRCLTTTLGSSTDSTVSHVGVDGVEGSYIANPGAPYTLRAVGDTVYLGGAPWNSGALYIGKMANFLAYPTQIPPADWPHICNYLIQQAQNKGFYTPAIQNLTTSVNFVVQGNSRDNGTPGLTSGQYWPAQIAPTATTLTTNNAANGKTLRNYVNDFPVLDAPAYSQLAAANIYYIGDPANDFIADGFTAAQVNSDSARLARLAKHAGYTVVLNTMLDLVISGSSATAQAVNAYRRQLAEMEGYYILDFANDPNFGASLVSTNGQTTCPGTGNTWFQTDCLHETAASTAVMAPYATKFLNYITGSTSSNPTLVSAATYSMAYGDRYVRATANTTITLPASCFGIGPTTIYTIDNTAGVTVTAQAPSGYNLNGVTAGTVTVPQGVTSFRSNLTSATASGCNWTSWPGR